MDSTVGDGLTARTCGTRATEPWALCLFGHRERWIWEPGSVGDRNGAPATWNMSAVLLVQGWREDEQTHGVLEGNMLLFHNPGAEQKHDCMTPLR